MGGHFSVCNGVDGKKAPPFGSELASERGWAPQFVVLARRDTQDES